MSLNFIMEDYAMGMIDNIEEVKERIWASKYQFKRIYSYIEFPLRLESLGGSDRLYDIFLPYTKIKMINVKSCYKDEDMNSYDYIKIHINNIWAYSCVKDCYLPKVYYKELYFAKNTYYNTIKEIEKNDLININIEEIERQLLENKEKYEKEKLFANNRKMKMNFDEFKVKVNMYLDRISCNFKPIDIYEEETFGEVDFDNMDFWTDDNYAVGYINKSLTGYFRMEYLEAMGVKRGKNKKYGICCECGRYFEKKFRSRRKYCKECAERVEKVNKAKRDKNRIRNRARDLSNLDEC